MRTIVISDIDGEAKSIIPYGLNIGKYTGTRVEILHVIDPRLNQGKYSPVADSKSITPGKKLSHEEIIQKKKDRVESALSRLLSKEASRLNYPLRIETSVEVDKLVTALQKIINAHHEPLLVTSTEPGSGIANGLGELLSITGDLECPILVIPAGYDFSEPGKAVMVTDFSEGDYGSMKLIFRLLKPFKPLVYACAFVKKKQYLEMELKARSWEQVIKTYADPSFVLKASVLRGGDQIGNLRNYIRRNNPGLVITPKRRKTELGDRLFTEKHIRQLIESLERPVLLY